MRLVSHKLVSPPWSNGLACRTSKRLWVRVPPGVDNFFQAFLFY